MQQDGVAEALQHLQLGHSAKKVLIIVSDGGDNASRETYARILALAQRFDAVIYAIGSWGRLRTSGRKTGGCSNG